MNNDEIIGILGGMGMFATTHFINILLLKYTSKYEIKNESELPKYIIYSNPKIPSRSRHIYLNDKSPLPLLKKDIIKLNNMGVSFIIIPCNTVHYYYNELQSISNVKILNVIKITSQYLIKNKIPNIFVLGTEALIKEKLYSIHGLHNVEYLKNISEVRKVIDAVKHNKVSSYIINKFICLLDINKYNILCCSELSLLYNNNKKHFKNYNIIDPMDVVADFIVNNYYNH